MSYFCLYNNTNHSLTQSACVSVLLRFIKSNKHSYEREIIMTDKQIIQEVKNYLADNTYRYAVLIDGEWGSGKTYFVKNQLTDAISQGYSSSHSSSSSISCYGSLFDRAKRIIDRIGCIFRKKILNPNQAKTVKYISLYGCKSYADIQDRVAMEFFVDFFWCSKRKKCY